MYRNECGNSKVIATLVTISGWWKTTWKGLLIKSFNTPKKRVSVFGRFRKGIEALTEFSEKMHFLMSYKKASIRRRPWTILFFNILSQILNSLKIWNLLDKTGYMVATITVEVKTELSFILQAWTGQLRLMLKCWSRPAEIYSANDGYSQQKLQGCFQDMTFPRWEKMALGPGFRPVVERLQNW